MPYVSQESRARLNTLRPPAMMTPGELNYCVTQLVLAYLPPKPSYAELNAAIGALECAKLELYRRVAAPYEDAKREQNGDVYL
jgi:hypothetical protein